MCNKQCGALPPKPTYAEVTDRINALGYALSILSENRVASASKQVLPVDKAIDDIAKELSSLTNCKPKIKPQPPKAPTPPEARVIVEGKPQD